MAQLTLLITTNQAGARVPLSSTQLDADGHTIHDAQDTAPVVHDRTLLDRGSAAEQSQRECQRRDRAEHDEGTQAVGAVWCERDEQRADDGRRGEGERGWLCRCAGLASRPLSIRS
jgi:hypothetical protein